MQNLRRLCIVDCNLFDQNLLLALMAPPEGERGWLCPKLQNLRLEGLTGLVGEDVVQLLRSRPERTHIEGESATHIYPLPWLDFSVVKCKKLEPWYQVEIDNWRAGRGLKGTLNMFRLARPSTDVTIQTGNLQRKCRREVYISRTLVRECN